MDIRTTVNNVANDIQFERMDEYGSDLIEVSSHVGARPKCAPYQGRLFSRSGKNGYTTDLNDTKVFYSSWASTSYGEAAGLLGINCGHQVYPFFPGLSRQTYHPYPEPENSQKYNQSQGQRYHERQVRKSKRECAMLDAMGDKEGFQKASVLLKQREAALKNYCKCTGRAYKSDRVQVSGFGRSTSAKVTAANKSAQIGIDTKVERALSVEKGKILGIATTGSEKIPLGIQKRVDQTLHKLCKSMGIDSSKINEIIFEDLGRDIARASITADMRIKLKFNQRLFASETELKRFLAIQVDDFTPKGGLDGYITHELGHVKEYLYAIKRNTVNDILDTDIAFDEISRSVYATEILKDALNTCNLDYNDVIIADKISLYGTYNASEAIAEAISNREHNDLCDKIKSLIEKKWG